jgi:MraZ protein
MTEPEPAPAHGVASCYFFGRYRLKIDEKGRLTLPSAFRRALPDGSTEEVVLLVGPEQYIEVLPNPEWQDRMRRAQPGPAVKRDTLRAWRRGIFGQGDSAPLDEKGRMTIPQGLLEAAEIERDVIALGVDRVIELWNPDRFFDYEKQHTVDASDVEDILY